MLLRGVHRHRHQRRPLWPVWTVLSSRPPVLRRRLLRPGKLQLLPERQHDLSHGQDLLSDQRWWLGLLLAKISIAVSRVRDEMACATPAQICLDPPRMYLCDSAVSSVYHPHIPGG